MSVQFGRWNFEGQPPEPEYIGKVSAMLAPFGPDSDESYAQNGVTILYRALCTSKEAWREKQPHVSASGTVITWDGRLDNRSALIDQLGEPITSFSTDVEIVAAAYERWGEMCFAKIIGDWALSIWNSRDRSLLLAKDPIGKNHLYYLIERDHLAWSTILDALVLCIGHACRICEEYIAGWFASNFPAHHLTPYIGIHSVPPSCFVLLRPEKAPRVSQYWDFVPSKRIVYRNDCEYEEHFRHAFFTAVQRRLRSDRPVLADLSGGMDSASIVCMADLVIAQGKAECPRLDTISWYSDNDPDNDERPYLEKVEEKRGRTGGHIDLTLLNEAVRSPQPESDHLALSLTSERRQSEHSKRYSAHLRLQGSRVRLSGLGGDSVTGSGVPTPTPELQDLLARGQFPILLRQLSRWAHKMNKPRLPLILRALMEFCLSSSSLATAIDSRTVPWLMPGFVNRNRVALSGYPFRVKLSTAVPSFQHNLNNIKAERRLLASYSLPSDPPRDIRYPFLDRDLLEFMFAIPREQVVGVGIRRYLMRRALCGIVPNEILNRKRRAVVTRVSAETGLANTGADEWPVLGSNLVSADIGIVDPDRLREVLQNTRKNNEESVYYLRRTLQLEAWLGTLSRNGILGGIPKEPAMSADRAESQLPGVSGERVQQPSASS